MSRILLTGHLCPQQIKPDLSCFTTLRRLTQYGDDLIILNDLQGTGDDEAEGVHALADVEYEVPGCTVGSLKLHSQRAQAAVAGEPERRVVVEDLSVKVDADVGPHVFGTNGQNLREDGIFKDLSIIFLNYI